MADLIIERVEWPNESKLSHADRRQGSETKPNYEK